MKNFIILIFYFCLYSAQCTAQVASDYWAVKGNINTDPNTNFVGTVDNVALSFRTFNQVQSTISTTGLFTIYKNATSIQTPTTTSTSSMGGIVIVNSVITGNLDLNPFKEKGRIFTLINYSGAILNVNTPIKTNATGTATAIATGQRWQIVWDGLNFIRIL